LGVPTIWVGVADHLDQTGGRLTSVKTIAVGGSAPTAALVSRIEDRLGGQVRQIWGMTETSPLGRDQHAPCPKHAGEDAARHAAAETQAGPRPSGASTCGSSAEDGEEAPRAMASAPAPCRLRGPWVSSAYFKARQS